MEDEDRYTRITLRIPKDLHQRVSEEASRASRSLNAELISRVETSFVPSATEPVLREAFKELAQHQKAAMVSVSLVRDMLAAYVVSLFKRLPKADQEKDDLRLMHDIARATMDADEEGLAIAATKKLKDIPGLADIGDPAAYLRFIAMHNQQASKMRRKVLDSDEAAPDQQ